MRVRRISLGRDSITIEVEVSDLLRGGEAVIRLATPTRIRRRGVERRLVLGTETGEPVAPGVDPALVKAIVRAKRWFEILASGRARSLAEIAEAEGVTGRYVGHLLPLAFLAPDIVSSILAGTQPADLTAEVLTKRTDLPASWEEQRSLLRD